MPDPLVLVTPPNGAVRTTPPTGRVREVPPPPFAAWGGVEVAWVHLSGELDIAASPQLVRTLGEPQMQARLLVVDLREVTFMDSSGVHAILDAGARARERQHRVIVLRGPPAVDRVLTLTGAAETIEIFDLDPVAPSVQVLLQLVDGA